MTTSDLVKVEPNTKAAPVTDAEFDSVVSMRLSDAIRQGAQQGGVQANGWGDGVGASCALMAASVCLRKNGYQ